MLVLCLLSASGCRAPVACVFARSLGLATEVFKVKDGNSTATAAVALQEQAGIVLHCALPGR
jgi:hypothetical protein